MFSKVPIKVMSSYDIHAVVLKGLQEAILQNIFKRCVSPSLNSSEEIMKMFFVCFFYTFQKVRGKVCRDVSLCKQIFGQSLVQDCSVEVLDENSTIRFWGKVFICVPVVEPCPSCLFSDLSCV